MIGVIEISSEDLEKRYQEIIKNAKKEVQAEAKDKCYLKARFAPKVPKVPKKEANELAFKVYSPVYIWIFGIIDCNDIETIRAVFTFPPCQADLSTKVNKHDRKFIKQLLPHESIDVGSWETDYGATYFLRRVIGSSASIDKNYKM
jgi:hypothetical protein